MIKTKKELAERILFQLEESGYVYETNDYHVDEVLKIIERELADYVIVSGLLVV